MSLPTNLLHLTFATELITQIDQAAAKLYITRSEFIRQATVEKVRQIEPTALPSVDGLNILMTDKQLEEMWGILRRERMRRKQRGLDPPW